MVTIKFVDIVEYLYNKSDVNVVIYIDYVGRYDDGLFIFWIVNVYELLSCWIGLNWIVIVLFVDIVHMRFVEPVLQIIDDVNVTDDGNLILTAALLIFIACTCININV